MTCSSGTYVRSIIHDLGITLNTKAHCTKLIRTKQGIIALNDVLYEKNWEGNKLIENMRQIQKLIEKYKD